MTKYLLYFILERIFPKHDVCLCLQPLSFFNYDFSLKMVEWFELLKLTGVGKVFSYVEAVHPNVTKVTIYENLYETHPKIAYDILIICCRN